MRPFVTQSIAALTAIADIPAGVPPTKVTKPSVDERLETQRTQFNALLRQQADIIDAQSRTITQQQAQLAAVPKMLADALANYTASVLQPTINGLIGGTLPGTLDTLAELVAQIQQDETGAAAMLAAQAADRARFALLEPAVNSLAAAIGTKAAAADLTNLANTVATKASTTALNTEKARLDALLDTTVPALQADIGARLLRTGDKATGPLEVPNATNKLAAPQFQQIFGGINSPRRTMENLTTGTTELTPLTDTTGQNRKILPTNVLFLLTGSLNLAATVTVKLGTTSGGAELYSKTYSVLTGLLGKVLAPDLPASAAPLPAGQRLYVTISGGGQWTCFLDAVFLPTAS